MGNGAKLRGEICPASPIMIVRNWMFSLSRILRKQERDVPDLTHEQPDREDLYDFEGASDEASGHYSIPHPLSASLMSPPRLKECFKYLRLR